VASLLLRQGTHPKVVADLLGHSTPMLTLSSYSHVVPALHREAAQAMDALFPTV
jgi:integrase